MQKFLNSEVERVQGEIESALAGIKIIIDTIAPWKGAPVSPSTNARAIRAGPAANTELAQPRRERGDLAGAVTAEVPPVIGLTDYGAAPLRRLCPTIRDVVLVPLVDDQDWRPTSVGHVRESDPEQRTASFAIVDGLNVRDSRVHIIRPRVVD